MNSKQTKAIPSGRGSFAELLPDAPPNDTGELKLSMAEDTSNTRKIANAASPADGIPSSDSAAYQPEEEADTSDATQDVPQRVEVKDSTLPCVRPTNLEARSTEPGAVRVTGPDPSGEDSVNETATM